MSHYHICYYLTAYVIFSNIPFYEDFVIISLILLNTLFIGWMKQFLVRLLARIALIETREGFQQVCKA